MHQLPECDSYMHLSFGGTCSPQPPFICETGTIWYIWQYHFIPTLVKTIFAKFHRNRSISSKNPPVGGHGPPLRGGKGGVSNFWQCQLIPAYIRTIRTKFHQNRSISSKSPPVGGAWTPPWGGERGGFEFLTMPVDSYIHKDHLCQFSSKSVH